MISTVKYWVAIVLFLAFVLGYAIYNQPLTNKNQNFHSKVVDLNDGYGYQIMRGEKIVILQEYIPGFPGKQKFATEDQAQKTAKLVVSKLEDGKSPILLLSDLATLNISTVVDY
ncbi:uncharacterized protein DUF4907 [Maribacter caenipelagi]|uniref:Uncharacterized protein DUF4907 n=1 Tax=Maribacter caenipelagi TaxID=1447781 RepID=A0A4R7D289_9FLAO|nr:DUF4907 domain-containing protein [Maribacter caenipelagi]TDS14392.1 uncharacterized protein DUF4907 [Maribacter caenipelagi]